MAKERRERFCSPEKEPRPQSLEEIQQHFIELYGERNNIWLPGRISRINLFNVALGDLEEAIRKEGSRAHLEVMFARLPSRIFCLAHGLDNVSVAGAMMEKYPLEGCVYCHSFPCRCQEKRDEADLKMEVNLEQSSWGLRDWQRHLGFLYGEKNKERGQDNVLNRLFKEVAELMNLEHAIPRAEPRSDFTARKIKHEYALELADCLAWTIAVANLLEVDLEKVALERFWPVCWNCRQKPCICINFSFDPVRV